MYNSFKEWPIAYPASLNVEHWNALELEKRNCIGLVEKIVLEPLSNVKVHAPKDSLLADQVSVGKIITLKGIPILHCDCYCVLSFV